VKNRKRSMHSLRTIIKRSDGWRLHFGAEGKV
jgi:hypothetical protein